MYRHYGFEKKRSARELPALDRWLLQFYAEHRIRYWLLVVSLAAIIFLPVIILLHR